MSRYLITGGAGFIGSHLIEHLLKLDHQITVLDDLSSGNLNNLPQNSNIEFIKGDILDTETLKRAFKNTQGIFHLAAIASVQKSINDWQHCNNVNLYGAIKVFQESALNNIPVVYASSAAVYGANENLPLAENDIVNPLSPYAVDKYSCELQAKIFGKLKNLKSFGLRFFNVYGLRQAQNSDYSGVISIFKQLAIAKKDLVIFGDGEQTRDFIHVSDVAKALIKAMNAADIVAPVCNICTGKSYSINQLAEIVSKILSVKNINYEPYQIGNIKNSLGDTTLALKLLNFKAESQFEEALTQFLLN